MSRTDLQKTAEYNQQIGGQIRQLEETGSREVGKQFKFGREDLRNNKVSANIFRFQLT